MTGQMLGRSTYIGVGRDRVVRNKRREDRLYGTEIDEAVAEYLEARAAAGTEPS